MNEIRDHQEVSRIEKIRAQFWYWQYGKINGIIMSIDLNAIKMHFDFVVSRIWLVFFLSGIYIFSGVIQLLAKEMLFIFRQHSFIHSTNYHKWIDSMSSHLTHAVIYFFEWRRSIEFFKPWCVIASVCAQTHTHNANTN